MRFLNWDILLFPDDSRVPIQEFNVKCHALASSQDTLHANKLTTTASIHHASAITQVPTMTCFIPSLDPGHSFRLSIHSWEKPKPSELLLSFKPPPERIVFEAKLFIDANLKAQRYLRDSNAWPEVIDNTDSPSTGFSKLLRFPPFHAEILQQAHWDARDGLGRIRVVVAEGIARLNGCGFDKLRDVVAFSFQHAPKYILEHSGIAWPNARMFQSSSLPPKANFDAHAHSPQRTVGHATMQQRGQYGTKRIPISMHSTGTWSGKSIPSSDDPFLGPADKCIIRPQKKTNTDVSMPDYPQRKEVSEMSGTTLQNPDFQQQVSRATVEDIIKELAPSKRAALLTALSPTRQAGAALSLPKPSTAQAPPSNRLHSTRLFEPLFRPQSAFGSRRPSNDSRRSTSGQSTVMSWDETPTLGDLWSGNSSEYPGLLPRTHVSDRRDRSTSITSKRKRSMSPPGLLQSGNDSLTNVKGMSTSPCKKTPTPGRNDKSISNNDTVNVGL